MSQSRASFNAVIDNKLAGFSQISNQVSSLQHKRARYNWGTIIIRSCVLGLAVVVGRKTLDNRSAALQQFQDTYRPDEGLQHKCVTVARYQFPVEYKIWGDNHEKYTDFVKDLYQKFPSIFQRGRHCQSEAMTLAKGVDIANASPDKIIPYYEPYLNNISAHSDWEKSLKLQNNQAQSWLLRHAYSSSYYTNAIFESYYLNDAREISHCVNALKNYCAAETDVKFVEYILAVLITTWIAEYCIAARKAKAPLTVADVPNKEAFKKYVAEYCNIICNDRVTLEQLQIHLNRVITLLTTISHASDQAIRIDSEFLIFIRVLDLETLKAVFNKLPEFYETAKSFLFAPQRMHICCEETPEDFEKLTDFNGGELLLEPITIASTGQTYERRSMIEYFASNGDPEILLDPNTAMPINNYEVTNARIDIAVKDIIDKRTLALKLVQQVEAAKEEQTPTWIIDADRSPAALTKITAVQQKIELLIKEQRDGSVENPLFKTIKECVENVDSNKILVIFSDFPQFYEKIKPYLTFNQRLVVCCEDVDVVPQELEHLVDPISLSVVNDPITLSGRLYDRKSMLESIEGNDYYLDLITGREVIAEDINAIKSTFVVKHEVDRIISQMERVQAASLSHDGAIRRFGLWSQKNQLDDVAEQILRTPSPPGGRCP